MTQHTFYSYFASVSPGSPGLLENLYSRLEFFKSCNKTLQGYRYSSRQSG